MADTQERCKESWVKNWSTVRCSRKATRDGFCKQHHPDTKAAKDVKWRAEWEAERAASAKAKRILAAERAELQAAEKWAYGEVAYYDYEADLRAAVDDLREAQR